MKNITTPVSIAEHDDENSTRRTRIAIIGCGPRGLQCLETLSRRLSITQPARIEIVIFDPAETLGAGCVYDPGQSRTFKMNFATQHIDFWKTASSETTHRSDSLIGWLKRNHPDVAQTDAFIPRAIVGQYLNDCFQTVRASLEKHAKLTIHHAVVSDLEPKAGCWRLMADRTAHLFDHVVLTIGHEGLRAAGELDSLPNQVSVFPVETNLSTHRIAPGSKVLIRGFGLTCIDAVLMLTEGRGGIFTDDQMLPRFKPSDLQPSCINIRCRSGRPMLAKPTAKIEPISDPFWTPFRERLGLLKHGHGHLNFSQDIWSVIQEAAGSLLTRSGVATSPLQVDDWYRGWSQYTMDASATRTALIESLAVALGRCPKDIPYALGESWRRLYPQLVELVSFGGLAVGQMQSFRLISREMERIAFGPPAENVAKLLRLIRDRHVTIGCVDETDESFDVAINAVIAPPHEAKPDGPLAGLINQGLVQIDESSGGIKVRSDGTIGGIAESLAIFGRATEGWIVGNDTLSRTLHTQIERWADGLSTSVKRQQTTGPKLRNELSQSSETY